MTKETRGRERIVHGEPDQIGRARTLLAQLEELWRSRFSQLDAVLAEPLSPTASDTVCDRPDDEAR